MNVRNLLFENSVLCQEYHVTIVVDPCAYKADDAPYISTMGAQNMVLRTALQHCLTLKSLDDVRSVADHALKRCERLVQYWY